MARHSQQDTEETPLLQNGTTNDTNQSAIVEFDKDGDDGNPREWPSRIKALQVLQIFIVALICPMASSIFAPAQDQISSDFQTSKQAVLAGQTCFMLGLGTGPLFLAPMSETFGRRPLFVICLGLFALVQIPVALSPNIATFIIFRTLSGLVGSVGVANGGGSIFDMFGIHERAVVLGIYLTGPLFGPTLGPLLGGLIVGSMGWRSIFWILLAVSGIVTCGIYFFLYETNATVILQHRRKDLEKQNRGIKYEVEGVSDLSIMQKVAQVSQSLILNSTTVCLHIISEQHKSDPHPDHPADCCNHVLLSGYHLQFFVFSVRSVRVIVVKSTIQF